MLDHVALDLDLDFVVLDLVYYLYFVFVAPDLDFVVLLLRMAIDGNKNNR